MCIAALVWKTVSFGECVTHCRLGSVLGSGIACHELPDAHVADGPSIVNACVLHLPVLSLELPLGTQQIDIEWHHTPLMRYKRQFQTKAWNQTGKHKHATMPRLCS
jgi:hypothetical protein